MTLLIPILGLTVHTNLLQFVIRILQLNLLLGPASCNDLASYVVYCHFNTATNISIPVHCTSLTGSSFVSASFGKNKVTQAPHFTAWLVLLAWLNLAVLPACLL